MIIEVFKHISGFFVPVDDNEQEKANKFKSNEQYQVEIKLTRNPAFHRKTFAFFKFCFDHWISDKPFMDENGQFDVFRKNLTVLAGFYDQYYTIKGEVRIEAKSLSYGSMKQDVFEQHYYALIQAAMKHIFVKADKETEEQLLAFFD